MQNIRQFDVDNQLFDLSTDVMTAILHCRDAKQLDLTALKKIASNWYQLALVKTDPRRG